MLNVGNRWLSGLSSHLPRSVRHRLRRLAQPAWLGTVRRTTPLSDHWGSDRGQPVDRFYIEEFLDVHRADIQGRVLEVKDSGYTRRFGRDIAQADVLDIDATNSCATIVADLTGLDATLEGRFDCFILTQTLQLIYDVKAAVEQAHRLLRPGGVLLVTVPVVSRIVQGAGLQNDYWRFTVASCRQLFESVFGTGQVKVEARGNVLTGLAFLTGLATEELSHRELTRHDPYFPLLVTVRAVKSIPAAG